MAFKVIQWSSGNVGKSVIRSVLERDDMTLVGLYVYCEDKALLDLPVIVGEGLFR